MRVLIRHQKLYPYGVIHCHHGVVAIFPDRAGNSAKPPHLNMAAEDNEVDVGGAPAVESVINTHSPSGRLKQIAQETAVDEFAPLGIPAVDMTETGALTVSFYFITHSHTHTFWCVLAPHIFLLTFMCEIT